MPDVRVGVALVALVLAGCGGGPASGDGSPAASPAPPAPAGTPVAVHVTSKGNGQYTTVTQMKNRRTIYTIRALSFEGDTLSEGAQGASGSFEQPHITFHDRQGGVTIADAPKAVLIGADKSVLMTGGVQARTQEGNVLHCDRLRYNETTEKIHGEGNVRLDTPSGLSLAGDVIDGDTRLANVRVSRVQR
jgi:lipopolysaccharide assembly outer membrane protein LptD (OstA)